MTASLIVVAVGAVAAAVGTGGLTARCSRAPSLFLLTWTGALFSLAVALAAQALGYLVGYTDLVFRCVEIAAQAVAPLLLSLGLVELIGRSVVSRFAMRLAVSAVGFVVVVIMASDPLSPGVTLGKSWPDPAVMYQLVPTSLIRFLAVVTAFTAVCAAITVAVRSGRSPEDADLVKPGLAGAAASVVVALPGLAMLAGKSPHSIGFALAVAVAAGLTWYAANTAARRDVAAGAAADPRGSQQAARDEDWDRPYARDGGGSARRDGGYGEEDDFWPPRPGAGGDDSDIRYPALAALAAERSEPPGGYDSEDYDSGRYDTRRPEFDSAQFDSQEFDSGQFDSAEFDSAQLDSAQYPAVAGPFAERPPPPGANQAADGADVQADLFGQITIYTLLEDRVEDFDRLTERVVDEVRASEPGTLVYIVHAVPTAPMQRILYEVYRDRPSYDEHLAQPYMARYTADRRSMVLATNAIELGLQRAKVSPLPSYSAISDILSESGIDLTGVTRSRGQGGYRPGYDGGAGHDRSGHDRRGLDDRPLPGRGPASEHDGWGRARDENGYR